MTSELITKAKACKSAEELLALAAENGVRLTAEQAAAKYQALHEEGTLSEEELDGVSGGGCGKEAAPAEERTGNCRKCGRWINLTLPYTYSVEEDGSYLCEHCEDAQIQGDLAAAYNRVAERHR